MSDPSGLSGGQWEKTAPFLGSNVATPYFSDTTGLTNGTTYYYQVNASDVSGTSGAAAALGVLTRSSS